MIESNTQTVIEINDKRNLAQVQPGVRVVGSPYPATQPHLFPQTLGPEGQQCLCHIRKQN